MRNAVWLVVVVAGLDEFLTEMRSGTEVHSTGAFTWDLERMFETLARFQHAQPEHYILRLLASAVEGGASWLRFDAT